MFLGLTRLNTLNNPFIKILAYAGKLPTISLKSFEALELRKQLFEENKLPLRFFSQASWKLFLKQLE